MHGRPYNRREERAMVRQVRLREVGYDTYAAYLKSPAWRDLKARYRASDRPQICMCGEVKVDLHHTTYERVGREELDDLVPLCRDCHTQAHILEAEGIVELDLKGFYYDTDRAAHNTLAEAVRKQRARQEYLAHDPVRVAQETRVAKSKERARARRPWLRDETPEQADARRARATAARIAKQQRSTTEKHAARVDANRPVPGPRGWQP